MRGGRRKKKEEEEEKEEEDILLPCMLFVGNIHQTLIPLVMFIPSSQPLGINSYTRTENTMPN